MARWRSIRGVGHARGLGDGGRFTSECGILGISGGELWAASRVRD